MRTLAIDLGTRRVGVALSDQGGRFATPYDVLFVHSSEEATEGILHIIEKEAAEQLVVGLPLNMDDSVGPAAKMTIQWAQELARLANKPLIFIDERLSSFAADEHFTNRKRGGEHVTRGQKKKQLDAVAAAVFLQDYLDGKLKPVEIL